MNTSCSDCLLEAKLNLFHQLLRLSLTYDLPKLLAYCKTNRQLLNRSAVQLRRTMP